MSSHACRQLGQRSKVLATTSKSPASQHLASKSTDAFSGKGARVTQTAMQWVRVEMLSETSSATANRDASLDVRRRRLAQRSALRNASCYVDLDSTDEGPNHSQHGHGHSVCCAVRDCSNLAGHRRNELGQGAYLQFRRDTKIGPVRTGQGHFRPRAGFLTTCCWLLAWFAGDGQAQRQAANATAAARKTQEQRSAILSVAPPMRDGTDLLAAAKAVHPVACDLPVNPPERSHVAGQHSA